MAKAQTFHRLYYHIVFATKGRVPVFDSPDDAKYLLSLFTKKVRDFDSQIVMMGHWREHVHQICRIPPKHSVADVYRQIKGFSSYGWNRLFPRRTLKWQGGVFIQSVDPDDMGILCNYVQNQWDSHETGMMDSGMEPFEWFGG